MDAQWVTEDNGNAGRGGRRDEIGCAFAGLVTALVLVGGAAALRFLPWAMTA